MVAKCCSSSVLVVLGVLVLGSAAPAMAQPGRANPYGSLFKPRDLKEVARSQQRTQSPAESRIPCGTTMVPANPQSDPKVARDPAITHFSMRVLPPGCR